MKDAKPDIAALMQEISAAAVKIAQEPRKGRARRSRVAQPLPVAGLEDNWDVWAPVRVTTHRGWRGLPIVALKRGLLAVLGAHNRELLKRQREFNRVVKGEITQLRQAVHRLTSELAELRKRDSTHSP